MQEKLNPDFLIELIGSCFKPNHKDLLQVVIKEVKYEFLPSEPYKVVFRELENSFEVLRRAPTIAVLSQEHSKNPKVLDLLSQFNKVKDIDKNRTLLQLETFIKEREFLLNYDEFGTLWNSGKKEDVYKLMLSTASKISNYSLTNNSFTKIFGSFKDRDNQRNIEAQTSKKRIKKVPFFIDQQDHITRGGMDRGDTYLYIGGSGSYKSTALRHHSYNAALAGMNVVHFMAEDTEATTTNLYDSALLGESLYNVEEGNISSDKLKELDKTLKNALFHKGEIYLKTFERFDSATLAECRQLLFDLIREVGEVHLIVFDYLELFDPSDGVKYKSDDNRMKRESIANKMKNMAMEFYAAVLTATQAMDIPQNLIEDPQFVIRRNHISEFKGLVKPFSGVFSLNQTPDEYELGETRIYNDKFRKYKRGQIVRICQSIPTGKFYSKKKTLAKNYFTPL